MAQARTNSLETVATIQERDGSGLGQGNREGGDVECKGGETVGRCHLTVSGTGTGYTTQQIFIGLMNVPPRNVGIIFDPFFPLSTSQLAFKSSPLLSIPPLTHSFHIISTCTTLV